MFVLCGEFEGTFTLICLPHNVHRTSRRQAGKEIISPAMCSWMTRMFLLGSFPDFQTPDWFRPLKTSQVWRSSRRQSAWQMGGPPKRSQRWQENLFTLDLMRAPECPSCPLKELFVLSVRPCPFLVERPKSVNLSAGLPPESRCQVSTSVQAEWLDVGGRTAVGRSWDFQHS